MQLNNGIKRIYILLALAFVSWYIYDNHRSLLEKPGQDYICSKQSVHIIEYLTNAGIAVPLDAIENEYPDVLKLNRQRHDECRKSKEFTIPCYNLEQIYYSYECYKQVYLMELLFDNQQLSKYKGLDNEKIQQYKYFDNVVEFVKRHWLILLSPILVWFVGKMLVAWVYRGFKGDA